MKIVDNLAALIHAADSFGVLNWTRYVDLKRDGDVLEFLTGDLRRVHGFLSSTYLLDTLSPHLAWWAEQQLYRICARRPDTSFSDVLLGLPEEYAAK